MMDLGVESEWKEGLDPEPEPVPLPAAASEPEEAAPQTFHDEMAVLLKKYGLDDYFYAVRSADGSLGGMTWAVTCKPDEKGYRARCAGLAFEVHGLIQHMEGSTWAQG